MGKHILDPAFIILILGKILQSPKTYYSTLLQPLSQANKLRSSFCIDGWKNAITRTD
jgi:hypothetical protein